MRWIDNLKNIVEHGNVGKCPLCGSKNTDYACTVVDSDKRNGYMDVWCNDCKKAYHISRMKITSNLKVGSHPQNLKY